MPPEMVPSVKILAATGWSFDGSLWDPLASRLAPHGLQAIDPLDAANEIPRHSALGEPFLLLGFSLGAFCLYPHLSSPGVAGGVFCGLAQTFIRSPANPSGAPRETIVEMKRDLGRDGQAVLTEFRRRCFKPLPVPSPFPAETPQTHRLSGALDLLLAADLGGKAPPVPVHLVQGTLDRILPVEGARAFSRATSCILHEIRGAGHALPLSHVDELAQIIRGALAGLP